MSSRAFLAVVFALAADRCEGATSGLAALARSQAKKAGQSASVSTRKGDVFTQVTSSPLIPSLTQELHEEATWGAHFGSSLAQWCSGARTQKAHLEDTLQRRVSEAEIALKQLRFEEQRLMSEVKLVNMTLAEQQQQMRDTAAAAEMATQEFDAEQHDLDSAMDAANRADRVAQLQQQFPSADGSATAEDAAADSQAGQPRLPRQKILLLRSRLEKARNAAAMDDEAMMAKLRRLSADQGAALLATSARAAGLRVEVAQRRREQRRWSTRHSDLLELLQAVRRGRPATDELCAFEAQQPGQMLSHISGMSQILRSLHEKAEQERRPADLLARVGAMSQALQKLLGQAQHGPEGWTPEKAAAAAESAEQALSPISDDDADVDLPMSFVQVGSSSKLASKVAAKATSKAKSSATATAGMGARARALTRALSDLKSLSWRFPEESGWYDAAMQRLRSGMVRVAADSQDSNSESQPSSSSSGVRALDDLRQFVAGGDDVTPVSDESAAATLTSAHSDEVTPVYSALLNHVRAKERTIAGRHGSCNLMVRSVAEDTAALLRVQQRAEERLGVSEATAKGYEEDGEYFVAQQKAMEEQLQQLAKLEEEVGRWAPQASDVLQKHVEGLVTLAASLESQPLAGTMVQDLSKQVSVQQDAIMMRRNRLSVMRRAVEAMDQEIMSLLDMDIQLGHHRLVQLKPELKLWSALAHSKETIQLLRQDFEQATNNLCSKDTLNKMSAKNLELRREETALRTAAAAGIAS